MLFKSSQPICKLVCIVFIVGRQNAFVPVVYDIRQYYINVYIVMSNEYDC